MTRTRTMVADSQTMTAPHETADELHSFGKVIRFVNCNKNAPNVIYKITTFPQKRMYIGATTRNLCDRMHDHLKDAQRGPASRRIVQALKEAEYTQVTTLFTAPPTITKKELQGLEKAYIRDLRDRILHHLPTTERHLVGEFLLNMRPDGRF